MKKGRFTSRLIMAVLLFLITLFAVYFMLRTLKSYSSNSFVLFESVQNMHKERENTIRSKSVFLDNIERIQSLGVHVIKSQDEIPFIVSKIEEYAEDVGVNIVVNSISLNETKEGDTSSGRSLSIEITANGSFGSLLNLMKMFENADYIMTTEEYYLREVVIIQPNRLGGEVTYRDISYNDDSSTVSNKTWMLGTKVLIETNIK